MTIHQDLVLTCIQQSHSINDLAKEINVNRSTMHRWLKGEMVPKSSKLVSMVKFLQTRGVYLNVTDYLG